MPRNKRRGTEQGRDTRHGSAKTVFCYRSRRVHPVEVRVRLVKEVLERKTALREVGRVFGVGTGTILEWIRRYKKRGVEGLEPQLRGAKRKRETATARAKREAVAGLRRQHPEWGTRRISYV